jgi:zinc transport system ATP-binding protein
MTTLAATKLRPLLTLHDLRVDLGGVPILRGINAEIASGKISALIGLNGSGKTTLLRAILREVPSRGQIRFHCGHDHSHPQPEHVGYVPQRLKLEGNFPLTVRDLLAISLSNRPVFFGISAQLESRLHRMLDMVGAPLRLLDSPMDKLSGGEQQRVLLALALEPSPELLLLDEPAAGIDFKDQEGFYQLIARLNRERNITIVLVSHDLSIVHKHAHHVLCLKDGHIHAEGPPDAILTGQHMKDTFGHETAIIAHHHHD